MNDRSVYYIPFYGGYMFFFTIGLAAVLSVTEENFRSEVLESKIPVVLDTYTDWCSYCKGIAPLFAELSQQMEGKVKFVKLNADAAPSLANGLGIEVYPTFLLYKGGQVVGRQDGILDREGFLGFLTIPPEGGEK
jgi:thioredoxin 1